MKAKWCDRAGSTTTTATDVRRANPSEGRAVKRKVRREYLCLNHKVSMRHVGRDGRFVMCEGREGVSRL